MSNYVVRGLPPIKLLDLLRKRKTKLKDFLKNSGIVSYSTLTAKCASMGVAPPSEEFFKKEFGDDAVSSPQEGIIVLDSPPLVKENGEKIQVDTFVHHENLEKQVEESVDDKNTTQTSTLNNIEEQTESFEKFSSKTKKKKY